MKEQPEVKQEEGSEGERASKKKEKRKREEDESGSVAAIEKGTQCKILHFATVGFFLQRAKRKRSRRPQNQIEL